MNPYIVIVLTALVDLIALPVVIKSIIKGRAKRKGLTAAAVVSALIAADVLFSFLYLNVNMYYDSKGNSYTEADQVMYYDRGSKTYSLETDKFGTGHFISSDGTRTMLADRVYVDTDGYIVFDAANSFKKSDKKYVYTDGKGGEYYRPEEIKWNSKGEIKVIKKD